ncbi:MAG: fenitrothion hydrolase [Actinobacteria bacterium]|nr:fenitrothion hydrolase [Actinomycetota bacterium]
MAGPALVLAVPEAALGHALVGKQDLPIPAWLFAWGASLVLIVSFAVLSIAWRSPKLTEERWRPSAGWLSALANGPVTQAVTGLIGALLLVVVIYTGLEGTEAPDRNFSITFVFVTFWLGLVLLSVLFGDVFKSFNPWRAVGRAFGGVFRLAAGQSAPPPLSYPERLGHWPAVVGIVAFVWLELIYGTGVTLGLRPETVGIAALTYSAITFVAMALFGVEKWIERGEAFSVYFRMFSRLSLFEVRDGRLGRRRFLTGAPSWGEIGGSLALVLVTIGVTTFDGGSEGALDSPLNSTFDLMRDIGFGIVPAFRLSGSIWMAIVLAGVALLYMIGIRGMHTVKGAPPVRELARSFAHTMIPIALAYLVAHYFSLFVFQEQAQFTYLLSDPLGDGSDLFGTASSGVDYGLIGATGVWYVQVAALVIGHVTALTLAHDRAVTIWKDPQLAARSQYWMLAVMVGFTCLGLYLLSQANA